MKAVVYEKNGSPEVLHLRQVDKPVPASNEVLVKIHAASLNAADYRSIRMGNIPKSKVFGADIAGRVESAGCQALRFKAGDEVFGDLSGCGFGGLAEYAAVPENLLAKKPGGVTFEDAAALPMAAVTALQGLRDRGRVQVGHRVLVYGAGGGVGTYAVQLAKTFGAEVTAVCSPYNVELVRSLGADHVLDYTTQDFEKQGVKYDLILAVNGSQPLSAYRRALAPKGTLVIVGGGLPQLINGFLMGPLLSTGGRKIRLLAARPDAQDLEYVIKLVENGKIRPVIDRCYPLEGTPAAMQYLSQGHARGKVIISIVQGY